jgi:hypothetical protein
VLAQALQRRVDPLLRPTDHREPRAGRGKCLGDAEIDAARPAGDEHRAAREVGC